MYATHLTFLDVLHKHAYKGFIVMGLDAGMREHTVGLLKKNLGWQDPIPFQYPEETESFTKKCYHLSLFSEQQRFILTIRQKLSAAAIATLDHIATHWPHQVQIIISIAASPQDLEKQSWLQACKSHCLLIQVASVMKPIWFLQEARRLGLRLSESAAARLVTYTQGNIAAAQHALTWLDWHATSAELTHEDVDCLLAPEGRFKMFALFEAALQADLTQLLVIYHSLHRIGWEMALFIWAARYYLQALAGYPSKIKASLIQQATKRISTQQSHLLLRLTHQLELIHKGVLGMPSEPIVTTLLFSLVGCWPFTKAEHLLSLTLSLEETA